jgi:hypothetical protein
MNASRREILLRSAVLAAICLAAAPQPTLGEETEAVPVPKDTAVTEEEVKPPTASYYNFQRVIPIGRPGIDSVEIAKTFVASHKPDATVILPRRTIDFPPGPKGVLVSSQQSVGSFLLGEEGNKRRKAEGKDKQRGWEVPMSSRNIYLVRCFIRVRKAGTYSFRVPADDGSVLKIGGVVIHSHFTGGMLGHDDGAYHSRADFAKAGLYPVELMFFDRGRHIGVVLYSDVDPKGPTREFGGGLKYTLQPILDGKKE